MQKRINPCSNAVSRVSLIQKTGMMGSLCLPRNNKNTLICLLCTLKQQSTNKLISQLAWCSTRELKIYLYVACDSQNLDRTWGYFWLSAIDRQQAAMIQQSVNPQHVVVSITAPCFTKRASQASICWSFVFPRFIFFFFSSIVYSRLLMTP